VTKGISERTTKKRSTVVANQKRTSDELDLDYGEGWNYVNLRVPSSMLREIDAHLMSRLTKTNRMRWIIGAMVDRMKREKTAGSS
jgi:hypothetical protein